MYTTLFRLYDPAIGRFHQIDPLTDFISGITPYQFGFNNPIYFNDPDGLLFGLGDKRKRQQRKRQRQLKRQSRKNRRAIARKKWRPNYNPDTPKRGNTPVGPTLDPMKPNYAMAEPDNNTNIVGVSIPEPSRPRPPKPKLDPTPTVAQSELKPSLEDDNDLFRAGPRTEFDHDPFEIGYSELLNKQQTMRFLRPYVAEANRNSNTLMRIIIDVYTNGNPNATVSKWWEWGTRTGSDLSRDRKTALIEMLGELGLINSNQIQVIEGRTFKTKKIKLEIIK